MHKCFVELDDRRYPILIGQNNLSNLEFLKAYISSNQVCIVTNDTVGPLYLKDIKNKLIQLGYTVTSFTLPDGEAYKTLEYFEDICDHLIEHQHHRNTTVIALGGGVVCDMAGFASACYQRGVGFIQIPTTLLAQVDASIGGKTAVNHKVGKNMIGAFYQPRCVVIDIDFLDTLPEREYLSGLAEVVKHAIIADPEFLEWLSEHHDKILERDPRTLIKMIIRSCEIKAEIVAQDEREESGVRAFLNFGHTIGHAIEASMGYENILHGEAVFFGMVTEANLSFASGFCSYETTRQVLDVLEKFMQKIDINFEKNEDKFIEALTLDKKNKSSDQLIFVLLKEIGKPLCSELRLPTISAFFVEK